MYKTLLPSSATKLEKALELTTRYSDELDVLIGNTIVAKHCPEHFLPFLAWLLSISDEEGWGFAESIEARRNLIERSIAIHRKKGTIWSIREVFRMLGLGEVEIIENIGQLRHDKTYKYNGQMIYGGDPLSVWATYIVRLKQVITNDQAMTIRRILDGVAPARSELIGLDFQLVAIRYNAKATYDGKYNYGSA